MKKFVSMLLCLLMLLSFAGCAPEEDTPATQLLVGYGRASIVPEFAMPLQGYNTDANRYFNNVADPIYVTALAFTDENDNTVILMQFDLADCDNGEVAWGMKDISKAYGIPKDNILVSATHTHSAPTVNGGNSPLAEDWGDFLCEQMVTAATQAMESRLPAEIYAASIETVGLSFIRHYVMEDGSIAGSNFGSIETGRAVRHTQSLDSELQMLRFKRQGGKDIVLANFQCHPNRAGSGTDLNLTSDIVGPMTTYVEEQLNCNFAYFSGAGGNVSPLSRIGSENITNDYVEQGQALGKYAVLACSNMEKLDSGAVQLTNQDYTIERSTGGETVDVSFTAFSIGDVGFVNVPYEMFNSNGKFVKDNSPFDMTIVTTIAYNADGYIPDAATFAYDIVSYEEKKCPYREGCGEEFANFLVELLNQLYPTRK